LSTLPIGAIGGDPQGGQETGGTPQNVAETSWQNPSQASPEDDSYFSTQGVSDDDQKMLKDIITDYRSNWMQDRIERLAQWMANLLYWKGVQVLGWDASSNCWYDALSWARNNSQESGEDTDLERWINPLVLMFCNVFTATMSQGIPKPVIKPENANPELQDIVTAKASKEAIDIIRSKNEFTKIIFSIYELLFLFGSYFRYTRAVIDGKMFGYEERQQFADMEIQTGPHFTCPNCGTESPAESPDGMNCPSCGAFMGQESYYAAGEGSRTSLKSAGTQKIPKAGVKWSLHSPLEIDCDPKCKGTHPLRQTAILAKDCEIDFSEACTMFPKFRDRIKPGAGSPTTPNADLERINRIMAISALGGITADNEMVNPTYSEVWVQPWAYAKKKDWDFADRMRAKFPEGLKISMVGEEVVDIRAAVLEKEWSHCALYANQGVYCAALANTAVSFNARFNRTMWILDDWAARAALGLNLANASMVDTEKMSGKPVPAGTLTPVPMKINGQNIPMEQIVAHYELPINAALWNYPMMLMTFAELILGIPRQLGGQGTQDDVETLGGQQLQLARSLTTLKPYFKNVKNESAEADQNAIECLQNLMKVGAVKEIQDVIESKGGAFQNQTVKWDQMTGNVRISADEDQELPASPEELRTAVQMMFQELTKGNPAAAKWFDVPANQDQALSSMVPDSVNPTEAQRLKTEADIQTIVDQGVQVSLNPDGSQGTQLPVQPEAWEDYSVAKEIVQRYMLENYQLRTEKPDRWQALSQYYSQLKQSEMQVGQEQAQRQLAVTTAGQPKPPAPDPAIQSEFQQQLQAAQLAIQTLVRIAQVDPVLTGGQMKDQVAASKEVIDSTVNAAKLMNGGK
jgi:hypothetical protein